MHPSFRAYLLLPALVLAACQTGSLPWGGGPDAKSRVQKTAPIAAETVLYARDGSVVTQSPTSEIPRRDVQGGEGSRTKILELYQRVVEERDRLQLTLAERESALDVAQKQLAVEQVRANELETRMKTAELSSAQLTDQNLDLAGRLAQAQIRRLEAEKQWLELSLSLPSKTVAASLNVQPPPAALKSLPATLKTPEKPASKKR